MARSTDDCSLIWASSCCLPAFRARVVTISSASSIVVSVACAAPGDIFPAPFSRAFDSTGQAGWTQPMAGGGWGGVDLMGWLRVSAGRLRQGWVLVVESIAAATVAWLLDTWLIGDPQPFFAPAAALLVLGQRMRRAIEVILGVAGGVLVADVVVRA